MSTIPSDFRDVLGQLRWAEGTATRCRPYTPKPAEAEKAWNKLRGQLRWGCKLHIVWQDEVDFLTEEFGADWEKTHEAEGDTGYLIALPGSRCTEEGQDGVVWVPAPRGEMGEGEPIWMQIWVLLANPMVAWVEVVAK